MILSLRIDNNTQVHAQTVYSKCSLEEASDITLRRVASRSNNTGHLDHVQHFCLSHLYRNVNLHIVKKEEIKNAVFYNHYGNMKDKIMESKKLENISHEDFTKEQGYLHGKSVDRCRTEFRIRTEMLDSFKDNYRAKNRTLERGQEDSDPGLQCEYCDLPSSRDSQAHCLRCPAWQKHRADLDLSFIEDLVTYFRRVLAERADRDEEERKKRRKGREEEEKRRKMANKRTRGQ